MELRVGRIRVVIDDDDAEGKHPARLLIELAAVLIRMAAEYDGDASPGDRGDDDSTSDV